MRGNYYKEIENREINNESEFEHVETHEFRRKM